MALHIKALTFISVSLALLLSFITPAVSSTTEKDLTYWELSACTHGTPKPNGPWKRLVDSSFPTPAKGITVHVFVGMSAGGQLCELAYLTGPGRRGASLSSYTLKISHLNTVLDNNEEEWEQFSTVESTPGKVKFGRLLPGGSSLAGLQEPKGYHLIVRALFPRSSESSNGEQIETTHGSYFFSLNGHKARTTVVTPPTMGELEEAIQNFTVRTERIKTHIAEKVKVVRHSDLSYQQKQKRLKSLSIARLQRIDRALEAYLASIQPKKEKVSVKFEDAAYFLARKYETL